MIVNFLTRRNWSDLALFKNSIFFNCLFCIGSWMRKSGRHWYFLNFVFLPRKCSVPFRAPAWTVIVRRCLWKLYDCSVRTFDTKMWPTVPGDARDKFCQDSPRPGSHINWPPKIQLCTNSLWFCIFKIENRKLQFW